MKYASGKSENVSLHRLKPVIESKENAVKRATALLRASKVVVNNDNDEIDNDKLFENDDEIEAETGIVDPELPNHEKFARKMPYTSKYGRKIKFADQNQEILIPNMAEVYPYHAEVTLSNVNNTLIFSTSTFTLHNRMIHSAIITFTLCSTVHHLIHDCLLTIIHVHHCHIIS